MSGLRGKNRRGRPKRNNITALQKQQHQITETTQISDTFYDLDVKQPLNIFQLSSQHQEAEERDNNSATAAPALIITPLLSENVINHHLLSSSEGEEELSSEDDNILLSATPSPTAITTTIVTTATLPPATAIQGVELSRLPKVQYKSLKGGEDDTSQGCQENEDEEEDTHLMEQKHQENQLLALRQNEQGTPYKRPENHYIHYIEPSDVELYETVEYDMDEQDKAWLELFNKERRKENLGDISPYLFECIMDKLEKEWFNLIKDAPKTTIEEIILPEDSACAVCDDTEVENSNAIVFCDGCNVAVHQDCYGIPYIPEGQWLCRKCMISPENPVSCLFCPNEGGAFKQTNTNQWGHLLCAIWIPECSVSNPIYMEPIDMIEDIPKSRWKLTCSLCRKKQGACIQCDNKHCFTAFHATCAKAAKLCMKMNTPHTTQNEGFILKAYCGKHTPEEWIEEHGQPATTITTTIKPSITSSRGTIGRERGRGRGRGGGAGTSLSRQQQQQLIAANNKVARAHQHHYTTGAPIAPDIILSKIDNLQSVKFCGIRKKPQLVTAIAHYWSLKRESRRGAPLLKRLHLEPWTASSKYSKGESDLLLRQSVITQLRADLEKVRMLSEQTQKREKQKLERTKKQKTYLEMILFPIEYVLRPILNSFMEIDKKKYFLNHVTAEEAPDYASIIAKSMCFSEIYQKLALHVYNNLDDFKADMTLIWQNSMEYNAKETHYYKVASKMEQASIKLFEKAEQKINQMYLKDGIWDVAVDDSIFAYEAIVEEKDEEDEQEEVVIQEPTTVEQPNHKVEIVSATNEEAEEAERESARQQTLEKMIRGSKEATTRKEATAIAREKKIVPKALAKVKRTSKIQTRRSSQEELSLAACSTSESQQQDITLVVKKKRGRATKNVQTQKEETVVTAQKVDISEKPPPSDTQIIINTESPLTTTTTTTTTTHITKKVRIETSQTSTEVHERHIQSLNVLEDDQKQAKQLNYLVEKPEIAPASTQSICYDIETMQPIITTPIPQQEITSSSSSSTTTKPAADAKSQEVRKPAGKRRKTDHVSSTSSKTKGPTPRLTRTAGLKASIEELTKRPKISQEARALVASYNGVSHLEKSVEVYKENRKKSAPVGWVYVEGEDDDGEGEEKEEDEPQMTAEETKAKRYAKKKRNAIPVPNFKRGEIVWARVTGFPSHPAKFWNWSDEECPPNILAGRRFQGDILVEFLRVPEHQKWGWVQRECICEVGDLDTDKARLAESLKKQNHRAIFIEEAKEGYKFAGSILGLDPEPVLDAVFNVPPTPYKRKRKVSRVKQ